MIERTAVTARYTGPAAQRAATRPTSHIRRLAGQAGICGTSLGSSGRTRILMSATRWSSPDRPIWCSRSWPTTRTLPAWTVGVKQSRRLTANPPAAGSEYRVGGTLLEQPGGGQGELAQHSGCVFLVPDLGELTVVRAEDLLPGHRDRPARRREPEQVEYAGVGVGHGPPAGHEVISSGSNSPDRSGRP